MSEQLVNYSREGKIAVVSINRPKALNALNSQVCQEIIQAMDSLAGDPSIHVVVIKGDENNFAAGADIGTMATATAVDVEGYVRLFQRCVQTVYQCAVPVIAYLKGYALGGGLELSLACDFRLAGESAKLGLPEVNLGIIPGAGGTQRLPRMIGAAKAKELIMLGSIIDAKKALELGIVDYVYQDDEAWNKTMEFAAKLAAKPLQAVKKAKSAVNEAVNAEISHGMLYEASNLLQLFNTQDQKEGMAAFLEKRKPNFIGR